MNPQKYNAILLKESEPFIVQLILSQNRSHMPLLDIKDVVFGVGKEERAPILAVFPTIEPAEVMRFSHERHGQEHACLSRYGMRRLFPVIR